MHSFHESWGKERLRGEIISYLSIFAVHIVFLTRWLPDQTVGFYVENARPANQLAIVTIRNGRPAGQNDP